MVFFPGVGAILSIYWRDRIHRRLMAPTSQSIGAITKGYKCMYKWSNGALLHLENLIKW